MTGKSGKKGAQARAERLKAALRENLKRRKAQERSRAGQATAEEQGPPPARPRESGDPGR
jgi:hypothetical protein